MSRFLVALTLLLVAVPAALAAGWGPPQTVAVSGGVPFRPPAITAAGPGFTVAWDDAEPVALGSLRAADILPERAPLTRTLGLASAEFDRGTVAALTYTGGQVVAAWSFSCIPEGDCPFALRAAHWTPGDRATRRVPPPGDGTGFSPRIGATPGGGALLVWQRPGPGGQTLRADGRWAVLDDGRWSRPGEVFPGREGLEERWPFATRGGVAVVGSTRLASVRRPGRGFDPVEVFPEAVGTITTDSAVAVRPGGRAVVATMLAPGRGLVVAPWRLLTASQDGAGRFGAPVRGPAFPAYSVIGAPVLATTGDGRAVVAWLRRLDGPRWTVMAAAETRPGGTWTRPRPLGPTTRPVGRPAIVTDGGGRVTVAWPQRGRILARTVGPGGRLGPTERVSGDLRGCGSPALARATDGRVAVAFTCGGDRRLAVAIRGAGA